MASMHLAFVMSTSMDLPVGDNRVDRVRRIHAIAVAIAVIAATSGLPMPSYPQYCDSQGRSARDLAREKGLDKFLVNWR